MLKVENLHVEIEERCIISGVTIYIDKSEVIYLFGKNGEGKSTLLRAIAGFPGYKTNGKIFFDGVDISSLPLNERARKGIVMGFQIPPEFDSIRVDDLLLEAGVDISKARAADYIKTLELDSLIKRPLNKGLSGGEKKRMETFITLMLWPKVALIDEPDSGVDIDSLKLIAKALKMYKEENPEASYLIVTHHGYLIELLHGNRAMVILNGKIICSNDPLKIYKTIMEYGYERCILCLMKENQ